MIANFLRNIVLFIFDMIDLYYHQVRIAFFLNKKKIKLDIFFDVGSHLGTYTDFIMKINPLCKFFLFEPQTKIFEKIKKKYEKNKNVKVFNLGISDDEKRKKFFINLHDLTSTFSNFNEESKYLNFKAKLYGKSVNNMNYAIENIQTTTLSKFILYNSINSIDLIKIDTEGYELKVLKGLEQKINIVKNILIEFHHRDIFLDYKPEEIHNFLVNNNFKLEKTFNFPFCWQDRLYSNKSP